MELTPRPTRASLSESVVRCILCIALLGLINHPALSASLEETISTQPLFENLNPDAYGVLLPINPTGYFAHGTRYSHPPRVEWEAVPQATRYELTLVQTRKILGVTDAEASPHFIEMGWDKIVPGKPAAIVIQAFNAEGDRIALSRMFPFYAAPSYDPKVVATQRRSYREAALKTFEALYNFEFPPSMPPLPEGIPETIPTVLLSAAGNSHGWMPYSFPNLHDWSHVEMLIQLEKIADEPLKEKIRHYARGVGDHLLMCRLPDDQGYAYGNMIRGCAAFDGGVAVGIFQSAEIRKRLENLVEPGKCGYSANALLQVFELTGDQKYKDAALAIAEVYAKTQKEDGSWPARVDGKTGEIFSHYATSETSVVIFLDHLQKIHPDERWETMRRKAINWVMKYPMRTYGWVVNFDDGMASATAENPYTSLSNWDLFSWVRYLSNNPQTIEQTFPRLRDQLDWNDNHFVWYGSDSLLAFDPFYPVCGEQGSPISYTDPNNCWVPMDFHTANWASALVDFALASGDDHYLNIACSAANALTQYQLDNGWTMTWMYDAGIGLSIHSQSPSYHTSFWPSGWAFSATLWAKLAALEAEGKLPEIQ